MDYSSWSAYEAVPLSNGIIARRTGLHYLKPAEDICAYYQDNFGTYWFNVLPKTDNTYSPSSEYYGCTLAPGIPLIPNLCRRPLRSPGSDNYEYSFTSLLDEKSTNDQNSWVEKNTLNNSKNSNGLNSHFGMNLILPPALKKPKVDYQDSGLDSDSDYEDSGGGGYQQRSQNTVTWLSWIITTITTVITVVTETVTSRWTVADNQNNHVNTRVPLKHHLGVSWYQYPVLWLYKLAHLVHLADVWLLYKVHSVLRLDSLGTPQQRRKWALLILLIPLLIWAGLFIADSFPSSETFNRFFNTSTWESVVFSPVELIT